MFQTIRNSKFSKVLASYLTIQLIITMVQPTVSYALTSGPSQPEFNSFTPIGTSDMVNLTSGDFNYNIPIMDVGGYPLNLAYDSGITMDQEASWVGLGWNLNVGQIARSVRGIPDDFNGDKIRYENDAREVVTLGGSASTPISIFGSDVLAISAGLGVQYNNLTGYSPSVFISPSYELHDNVTVDVNLSASADNGPSVSANVRLTTSVDGKSGAPLYKLGGSVGLSYSSRQALSSLNLSPTIERTTKTTFKNKRGKETEREQFGGSMSVSGGIPFNLQSYTPPRRFGMTTSGLTFNGSGGPTVFGLQTQLQGTGYGSYQRIKESDRNKEVPAFGYEHTEEAHARGAEGILDINRENDRTVNKFTNILSVPHTTYDQYAIQAQGIGGSFRPYRGQVGHLYDTEVRDNSDTGTFGAEIGLGSLTFNGYEVKLTDMNSSSSRWSLKNNALRYFYEHPEDDDPINYERTYFKAVGDLSVDADVQLFDQQLLGNTPARLKISGSKYNRKLSPILEATENAQGDVDDYTITSKIKRTQRQLRNQAIVAVTNKDAELDPLVHYRTEAFAQPHHTVGVKVLKPDGSTYVFGESAYNTTKIEATFDVSGRRNTATCDDGLVSYNQNFESNRSPRSDGFFNRVTTPAYAHTYLLSSVLSADYEDLTGNGPSQDDLGAYTLFTYKKNEGLFNWRIPFEKNKASFNEGLKSNTRDEKGNYVYGEKETKYVEKIETKTHVAFFKLSDRNDGRGVEGEHGGLAATDQSVQKKIDKIYLFSKPDYTPAIADFLENNTNSGNLSEEDIMQAAIKIAHFQYVNYDENGNYIPNGGGVELCPGILNASQPNSGKLTLDKVYFTYRGSFMGKYTPYSFEYADFDYDGNVDPNTNPSYNPKGYNTWGGYKYNDPATSSCNVNSPLSTVEFPYVEQDKTKEDVNARAWSLSRINLPSGGMIDVSLEADDYQYVQEKRAVQMFKVVGAGDDSGTNGSIPQDYNSSGSTYGPQELYTNDRHKKYLYVRLSDGPIPNITSSDFIKDYLDNDVTTPIHFRFLLNMGSQSAQYDYVEGYFVVDDEESVNIFQDPSTSSTYAAVPMAFLELDGFFGSGGDVNPISKAGWYFGRTYLNRIVYGNDEVEDTQSFMSVVEDLAFAVGDYVQIFESPNRTLQEGNVARKFIKNKSWIRLYNQDGFKLGGGARVSAIKMHDAWDVMTEQESQFYGQQYDYTDDQGKSSGVATFEPNASKENPYVIPFYDKASPKYREKITSPKESNYVERPVAGTFYPSASVTYGKVTVANLARVRGDVTLTRKATGKVVTRHFTTKDFPTKASFTALNPKLDNPSALSQLFKFSVKNHLTMSQGFVVETNDMNGKVMSQEVYAENALAPISGVTYKYKTAPGDPTALANKLPTLDENGNLSEQYVGLEYEVTNDFRESKTNSATGGINANLTTIPSPAGAFPVALPLPTMAKHETLLRTASSMKHIHRTGIMVEKEAFDLGSKVSTHNLAWDQKTGNVLLTRTINEYDDNYFNFTYPVHWYEGHKGMDMASRNIHIKGRFSVAGPGYFNLESETNTTPLDAALYLQEGDEVTLRGVDQSTFDGIYWVAGFNNGDVMLMGRDGTILNECPEDGEGIAYDFKLTRSGFRNQHTASMASVTSMLNPLDTDGDGVLSNSLNAITYAYGNVSDGPISIQDPKIINASAVAYKGTWLPQQESNLAPIYLDNNGRIDNRYQYANPYLYNVKNEWRAEKSLAYLTGRRFIDDATNPGSSPRREGFFTQFNPYYRKAAQGWERNSNNWTFASAVTQYSPYGAELENVDALARYSAAQYGYAYTLPTAVGSNTRYRELGFDGFEDYTYGAQLNTSDYRTHHFSFKEHTGSGVIRSKRRSHTGQYSFLVSGENNSVQIQLPMENATVEPRDTCPVDPGENEEEEQDLGEPSCLADEYEISIDIEVDRIVFPDNYIDFGPDGPHPTNPIDFQITGPLFQGADVFYNADHQKIYIDLNYDQCQNCQNQDELLLQLTLRDGDGEVTEACTYRIFISRT